MKDYGIVDSWYNLFKVDLNEEFSRVISLRHNGHILFDAKTPIEWELSSYDPSSQQVKNLGIQGVLGHFHVDTFEENLVLLDKKNDAVSRRGVSRKRKDRFDVEQQRRIEELRRFVNEQRRQIDLCQGMVTQISQENCAEERQRLVDLLQSMMTKLWHERSLWESSSSENCGPLWFRAEVEVAKNGWFGYVLC
ncbi:hypothetical protein RHSIM_Rhsim02G0167900 [Rhododendron simsii]|uniref:Uncharacterized protein n=1 Tax=Rhododendron simsii TaxID=118357 RepID=A0A834HFV2_RHOSS|nr:hypothetical protein RHSIM_Rhsim02G0167900 [Rhododendron simsii]